MALKMPKLFGEPKAKLAAVDGDLDVPTTQVRMNAAAQSGYDPLASVSVMEQLRAATAKSVAPWKLPVIGDMPVAKQLSVLGTTLLLLLAAATVMVFLDGRAASQGAAATATATEMQMLSQRLARGSAIASQGQAAAFPAVKDSRERFAANLNAFLKLMSIIVTDGSRVVPCGSTVITWVTCVNVAESVPTETVVRSGCPV